MSIDVIKARLEKVKNTGTNQWQAICPAHNDTNPSLSIKLEDNGKILLHCFAGCDTKDVLKALDLSESVLFPDGDVNKAIRKRSKRTTEKSGWKGTKQPEDHGTTEGIIVRVQRDDMRAVRWLVRDTFPLGKVSIIAGLPGTTKSMAMTYLIAAMQGKVALPNLRSGVTCDVMQGDALVVTCEDDPEDAIAPRLAVYGVDPYTVPILRGTRITQEDGTTAVSLFDMNTHLDVVDQFLADNASTRLVIIDPVQTFMGKTELNGNADVNQSLTRLVTLAQKHNIAVLLVMHHNKKADGSAMDRVIGSRGFSGTARAMWTVSTDPDDGDRHIMACTKMQYAKKPLAMAYRIKTRMIRIEDQETPIPYLDFENDRIDVNADDLVQSSVHKDDKPSRTEACVMWMEAELQRWGGPMELSLLRKHAREKRFSNDTFANAKRDLDPVEVKVKAPGRSWRKFIALRHEDFATEDWQKAREDIENGRAAS